MVNKNSGSLRRDLFFDEDHRISTRFQEVSSHVGCVTLFGGRCSMIEVDYSPEGKRIRERRVPSCI